MGVQVLRIIEYVYPDVETAERDRENWQLGLTTKHMRMRSVEFPMTAIEWHEGEDD